MVNLDYFDVAEYVYHKKLSKIQVFVFVSVRNIGKTYSSIQFVFNEWEKDGRGFGWIFRTQEEVKEFYSEFDAYVDAERYLRRGNNIIEKKTGIEMGKFISITRAKYVKNNQYIYNLIFDEFIPLTNYYIPEEYKRFAHITKTMERTKEDFRIIMLSNFNSQNNAYFLKWKVFWNNEKFIQRNRIGIWFIQTGEYLTKQVNGGISDEIASYDDKYYDFAIKGKFSYDDNNMVYKGEKLIPDKYFYHIELNDEKYTIYRDNRGYIIFDYYDKKQILTTLALTSKDAFNNNNHNINEELKEKVVIWKLAIFNKKCVFKDFAIKEEIIAFLVRISNSYDIIN